MAKYLDIERLAFLFNDSWKIGEHTIEADGLIKQLQRRIAIQLPRVIAPINFTRRDVLLCKLQSTCRKKLQMNSQVLTLIVDI